MKNTFFILLITMFTFSNFNAQENADAVLKNAIATAKKENKKAMLFFHASWCGWCKLMEKNMQADETKAFFSRNFILAPVDVLEQGEKKKLENPGGEALMEKYKGKNAGVPFWVIFDGNGNVLTDSFDDKGQNLGSPATPEEVETFITKLQKTTDITAEEITAVQKVFTKKN